MKRIIVLAGVVAATACGGAGFRHIDSGARPVAARVVVEDVYYWTDTVRIATGQVVEWVNRDAMDHTVSFEGRTGRRLSGKLKAKGTYAVRFDAPGLYKYYCDPHPTMRAVVLVH
jgi:plastocyanin